MARGGRARVAVPESSRVSEERPLLALEWIAERLSPTRARGGAGRGLARAARRRRGPAFGSPPPGAARRLMIGRVELAGATAADWPAFYAEHRLAPLLRPRADARRAARRRRARDRGSRSSGCRPAGPARTAGAPARRPLERQRDRRPRRARLAGRSRRLRRPPRGRPRDAAAVRRVGAARLPRLRGGAPAGPGRSERVELHQLYPLLVHAVLFGGSYGAAAVRAARRQAAA